MVVIVDLDDEPPPMHGGHVSGKPVHHSAATAVGAEDMATRTSKEAAQQRENPNVNGFSAALSCYPIVRQLARQLDLNTLHDLSRTCRQFRANLLEYRGQLIKHTLHCEYEQSDGGTRMAERMHQARGIGSSPPLTSGRIVPARCARDMVAECQRCATVVCRNCTIKPPPTPALRARHRRLCRTCTKAPLLLLLAPKTHRSTPTGTPAPRDSSHSVLLDDHPQNAFTAPAFQRNPCTCDEIVWLCQPCGQQLRNADTMYVRAWTWRTRYSHYLGGVGTGAGEGNEGVVCGMGANCLAARVVEHEDNYDAESPASIQNLSLSPERWTGSSYHAQEIEGIGGWLKMKTKKQVSVGECVKIYEDEKDRSIQFLEREVAGKLRSWCSWCERVVLSARDRAEAAGERPPSSGSSSASSTRSEPREGS